MAAQAPGQPPPLDVEGPVRAEVFVVALRDGDLVLTGPCGPAPWTIETTDSGHPLALVERMARRILGEDGVTVVHSTSWRYEHDAVVLTFVAVVTPQAVGDLPAAPVGRAALARGEATAAPASISPPQVLEHALRHLAWLIEDDEAIRRSLGASWARALDGRVPAPFQQLG